MEDLLKHYSKLLDDSHHHLSNETLATYNNLRGLLSEKELNFIQTHLISCKKCSELFALIQKEDAEFDSIHLKTAKVSWQKSFRYAAVAVLVIAIGVWYLFYFTTNDIEQVAEDRKEVIEDSTNLIHPDENAAVQENQIKQEGKRYSPNDFAVSQVLENFINRNVRGEPAVKISAPQPGDTIILPSRFEWESSAEEFELAVMNNKNQTVFNVKLSDKSYWLEREFKPGLYYWKILVDGKLEAVGKFYTL